MSTAAQDLKNEAKPISQFEMELSQLLNKHSMENDSDTPDYILAEYLSRCLYAYNHAVEMRKYHSRSENVRFEREKGEREDGFLKALDERIKISKSIGDIGAKQRSVVKVEISELITSELQSLRDLYISTLTKKSHQ